MTYYGGKELAESFRTVRKNTIRIAEDTPANKYDFTAAPDTRSVRRMLVHIALSPGLQHHIHSNKINDLAAVNFPELIQKMIGEEARPRDKAQIIALLNSEGEKFASFLESVSESFLSEQVMMRPGADPAAKSRFEMLLSPKEHEMHHRGQLMVFERMIGVIPHLTRDFQAARMAQQAQQAQR